MKIVLCGGFVLLNFCTPGIINNFPKKIYKFWKTCRYEIVAVAEGSSTITGQVSQNRTSYTNEDILWGHRFVNCDSYDENLQSHVVDYKKFKQVASFDTPLCSARKLAEMQDR